MTSQADPAATGLRRFVRSAATAAAGPAPAPPAAGEPSAQPERCELCATDIPAEHGHIADLEAASLRCACRACYLLFTQDNEKARYRAVPDRYLADPARPMPPAVLDELEIPVGLAFFLRSARSGGAVTGFYPSPAGATECQLDLRVWQRLEADYPLLREPAEDVEAVLISRSGGDSTDRSADGRAGSIAARGVEYYLVPVDACYELAGRMRLDWRGFDGGSEARQSIATFLAGVRERARPFAAPGERRG
jgi:Family of unknown function (DUF5947)